MTVPEMLEHLEPGDCITHCLRSGSTRILDEQNRLHDAVRSAAARGIIFDVGHGMGSFDWQTAEAALEAGFEPTTISTDLHTLNINGPVYDMPATMSKFLLLGMPLERLIELTTARPAAILKQADQIGTLREGTTADVAILEKREGRFRLTDSLGHDRIARELLTAAVTVRAGRILPGGGSLNARRLAEE
jgi:dihydroorotase